MKIRNKPLWDKCLANNQDGYGAAVNRYAERWANMMESYMDGGWDLKDIVERCSDEADTEGITGFQWGAANATLREVWEHGEELDAYYTNKRAKEGW